MLLPLLTFGVLSNFSRCLVLVALGLLGASVEDALDGDDDFSEVGGGPSGEPENKRFNHEKMFTFLIQIQEAFQAEEKTASPPCCNPCRLSFQRIRLRTTRETPKENGARLAFAKDVDESDQSDSGGDDSFVVRLRKLPSKRTCKKNESAPRAVLSELIEKLFHRSLDACQSFVVVNTPSSSTATEY